jgi:NADPH2:quinone reductase
MKIKAIRIHEQGPAENMRVEAVDLPAPKAAEVRVRHEAIGVNYIDTYHRSGLYKLPLPTSLGMEAAGIVDAVGGAVETLRVGDRVAYCSGPIGAYAEANNVNAARTVKLPDGVTSDAAAAMLLKGLTVQYLFRQTYVLSRGETILFHAAAGGCGLIACQWAKQLGVTMIGTVSSAEKAKLAMAHGCAHTIDYSHEDVAARVAELTGGKKVPVVYDGVGKDTFNASLDSLAPRGLLVSFGNASGPVTGVDLGILSAKGSLYLTRPTLATYTATSESLHAAADELFGLVARGAITPDISRRYKLADAADAHRALQGRGTTGSILLTP